MKVEEEKKNSENSENLQISIISQKNQNEKNTNLESAYSSNILQQLHQKEIDEWAVKVKNDHSKFLQDQKEKLQISYQLKNSTKEFYEMQILEKEIKKKIEREDLNKFVKIRDENLKKIDEKENHFLIEAKEKVKSQKELKIKMLNDFYDMKKSQKLKEEIEKILNSVDDLEKIING